MRDWQNEEVVLRRVSALFIDEDGLCMLDCKLNCDVLVRVRKTCKKRKLISDVIGSARDGYSFKRKK
jgi:hypothetical protein